MRFPFFVQKVGQIGPRFFTYQGVNLRIITAGFQPTMKDKHFLIFCMSRFEPRADPGLSDKWHVEVGMKELVVGTHRSWGGKTAKLALASLERLFTTSCIATIPGKDHGVTEYGFHLLEFQIIKRPRGGVTDDVLRLSLHPWFARAILDGEVAAMPEEYFDISSALDQRLYELARSSASYKDWPWTLRTLATRIPFTGPLYKLRESLKEAVQRDAMLDFQMQLDLPNDKIRFVRRLAVREGAEVSGSCLDGKVEIREFYA